MKIEKAIFACGCFWGGYKTRWREPKELLAAQ